MFSSTQLEKNSFISCEDFLVVNMLISIVTIIPPTSASFAHADTQSMKKNEIVSETEEIICTMLRVNLFRQPAR